ATRHPLAEFQVSRGSVGVGGTRAGQGDARRDAVRARGGMTSPYRGRIAPTPTGDMHVGHARTFVEAWRRAEAARGSVVLRIEDLDPLRCRDEWTQRAIEDLAWLGIRWSEEPSYQSRRRAVYERVWRMLRDAGQIYPSSVSRREVRDAAHAPH